MPAYGDNDQAFAGLPYGTNKDVRSFVSKEINGIDFGLPLFGYEGNDNDVYRYHNNVSAMDFDGDFVTGNSIILTVDGVAVTAVPFNGTHAQTMLDLIAQVEADIAGASASSNTGGDNNEITITIEDGIDRVVTEAITGGAGQVTGTETVSSSQVFEGFAMHTHKEAAERKDLEGNVLQAATAKYEINSSVNGMIEGFLWGLTDGNGASSKVVYVITSGADQGKITDVSTDNIELVGVAFDISVNAQNLAGLRLKN